jgi:hypothetical protein
MVKETLQLSELHIRKRSHLFYKLNLAQKVFVLQTKLSTESITKRLNL